MLSSSSSVVVVVVVVVVVAVVVGGGDDDTADVVLSLRWVVQLWSCVFFSRLFVFDSQLLFSRCRCCPRLRCVIAHCASRPSALLWFRSILSILLSLSLFLLSFVHQVVGRSLFHRSRTNPWLHATYVTWVPFSTDTFERYYLLFIDSWRCKLSVARVCTVVLLHCAPFGKTVG